MMSLLESFGQGLAHQLSSMSLEPKKSSIEHMKDTKTVTVLN